MKKHGIRGLLILALIWALIGAAWAEEMLPASIREAQSAEEANALLIQSDTGERLDVVSGQVRLIVQTRRDDMFCADYWRSGEEKGEFDLTAKENRYGAPYAYYIGTMCTRAVYSMALSYLGVDMTPVDMSVLAQRRTLNEPYDEITALVDGLARRGLTEATFDEMMAQYLNDERYSPLYIYMKRTNGVGHALLIVGYNAERKRFVAVDPSPRGFQGDTVRTYELSFAQNRQRVMRCPYAKDLEGAKVLQVYQWYWIGEGTEKEQARHKGAKHAEKGWRRSRFHRAEGSKGELRTSADEPPKPRYYTLVCPKHSHVTFSSCSATFKVTSSANCIQIVHTCTSTVFFAFSSRKQPIFYIHHFSFSLIRDRIEA